MRAQNWQARRASITHGERVLRMAGEWIDHGEEAQAVSA